MKVQMRRKALLLLGSIIFFFRNIVKYVVVLTVTGYFGRELEIPDYGVGIIIHETSRLSSSQIDMISTIGCVLGAIFLVIGGILADKHGRRLTWAFSLVVYEIGMLWLFYSHSFEIAMFAAVLMSSSDGRNSGNNAIERFPDSSPICFPYFPTHLTMVLSLL